ncbi:MAG: division/cell wall cluster transcriptional repressor MraZ [Bacteroidetes bacterium]|nr:division/cell wall cluster transcriptional repressor MraZ [Bacteroidota bacterium]
MFRGQFKYSVDSKERIHIPAKLRKHLSAEANETFVMTQGTALCIDLYPLDQWQKFEEKLLQLNPFQPNEAKFIRMILQHASEDSFDSQSRIRIPQKLLEYAKIEKEVIILGALKKIEVWNPKVYEDYLNSSTETYEDIAAKVMGQ